MPQRRDHLGGDAGAPDAVVCGRAKGGGVHIRARNSQVGGTTPAAYLRRERGVDDGIMSDGNVMKRMAEYARKVVNCGQDCTWEH